MRPCPLDRLVEPTVRAARAGVVVTPFQRHLAGVVEPIVTATEGVRALFAPEGRLLEPGEVFQNPGLAEAFESLAHHGLVRGPVGDAIVANQADHGHLTAADLARYEPIERRPLTVEVAGSTVHLNPLPAASGTLIAHTLAHLESPDPIDIARALLATSQARREAAGALQALASVPLRQRGTTHVSVIDQTGAACAVTVSNGSGSGEVVDGYGFMLNNILGEEDVNPGGEEGWPVNTRLSSMMCPTIIEQGDGSITALGSGGSNRIRSAICQVVTRLCHGRAPIEEAVDAPRLHIEGEHLDFEDLFDPATRRELRATFRDHRAWPEPDMFYGGVHTVRMAADGTFEGHGDARRDGTAIVVS